ncbi:MAG TPA: hypothetical protein VFS37_01635 [Conexibacter sp.]|nr:hypothetical protein [Conexibacter sp.]
MNSRHLIRRGVVLAAAFATLLMLLWSTPANADNVVADDQIVQGKLCVGTPCVNGEAFGNPALRVKVDDTPAINLVQTGNTFSAQTWDVAGNEANFFVRDATSGNRLPFRIRPGAPTSSIDVAATGEVTTVGIFQQDVNPGAITSGAEADGAAFLAALRVLPILSYTINADTGRTPHLAPPGREFRAAFGLGDSDTKLASMDLAAAALVAVKALDARVSAISLTPGPQGPAGATANLAAATRRIRALERSNRRLARSVRALQRQVRALLARG